MPYRKGHYPKLRYNKRLVGLFLIFGSIFPSWKIYWPSYEHHWSMRGIFAAFHPIHPTPPTRNPMNKPRRPGFQAAAIVQQRVGAMQYSSGHLLGEIWRSQCNITNTCQTFKIIQQNVTTFFTAGAGSFQSGSGGSSVRVRFAGLF